MSRETFTEAQLWGPKNVLGYPEAMPKISSSAHEAHQPEKFGQTSVVEAHHNSKKSHRKHK